MNAETVAALSPYIRTHINSFGRYELDLDRRPPAIDYELPILTPTGDTATAAAASSTFET